MPKPEIMGGDDRSGVDGMERALPIRTFRQRQQNRQNVS